MAVDQDLLADAVHHSIGFPLQSLLVGDDEDFPTSPELPKLELPRPREPRTELLRRVQLGIEDIEKWVAIDKPQYPSLLKVNYQPFMVGSLNLRLLSSPSIFSLPVFANFVTKGTDRCPNSGSTLCGTEASHVTKFSFSGRTVWKRSMYILRILKLLCLRGLQNRARVQSLSSLLRLPNRLMVQAHWPSRSWSHSLRSRVCLK